MNVEHVSEVKKSIGPQAVKVLTDIFRSSSGIPPGVPAARYRADHPELIEIIDRLETANLFLERDRESKNYVIRVYALPIVEDDQAKNLLKQLESAFQFFKSEYKKRLTEPITLSEIVTALNYDQDKAVEMLSYMVQSHDVWCGHSTDFPLGVSPTISISEQVLRHENFGNILAKFYEWHIVNPNKSVRNFESFFTKDKYTDDGFFTKSDIRNIPEWFGELDDKKKALILEIDKAVNEKLLVLPMIGLRTLIETIMLDHIDDQGTFGKNIELFKKTGFITIQHASMISIVVDAGNASAHRAYFPDNENLRTCIDVVKHLMHGIYILKNKVDKVAENTPQKQKVRPANQSQGQN